MRKIGYTETHTLNSVNTDKVILNALDEFRYLGIEKNKRDCEVRISSLIGNSSALFVNIKVIVNLFN